MAEPKKRVFVDFDGVLHRYTSKWEGPAVIPDGPMIDTARGRSSIDWLRSLIQSGKFVIHIYSRRGADPALGGIGAMKAWLQQHGLEARYLKQLKFETGKPEMFILIDDRCLQFQGQFPEAWELERFRPWSPED